MQAVLRHSSTSNCSGATTGSADSTIASGGDIAGWRHFEDLAKKMAAKSPVGAAKSGRDQQKKFTSARGGSIFRWPGGDTLLRFSALAQIWSALHSIARQKYLHTTQTPTVK